VDLAFTGDGLGLDSLGSDGTLRRWDLGTGRQASRVAVPAQAAGQLSLSADGRVAACARAGGAGVVMETDSGRILQRFLAGRASDRRDIAGRLVPLAPACVLSGDGELVTFPRIAPSDTRPSRIEVRRAATGHPEQVLAFSPNGPHVFFPGGRALAVAEGRDRRTDVVVVDPYTARVEGKTTLLQTRQSGPLLLLGVSPDGRLLAGADGTHAFLWERASREMIATPGLPRRFLPRRLVLAPGGQVLLAGPLGNVNSPGSGGLPWVVWDLHSRQVVRQTAPAAVWAGAALSPDGRTLALAQADSSILLYDVPLPEMKAEPAAKKELPRLWADLASDDAARAWRARRKLAALGPDAVSLLAARLAPAPARVPRQWLDELDSDEYATRVAATDRLAGRLKRGDRDVEMALRDLLERRPSLEAYRRAERLLRQVPARTVEYSPEQLRQVRAVAVLEQIANREAQVLLKKLAGGAPALVTGEARAALARLGRR
jgi:hypothetical protein